MRAPREARDRIADRMRLVLVPLTTTQTRTGAVRAGKRSGLPYRIEQEPDGRYVVKVVRERG